MEKVNVKYIKRAITDIEKLNSDLRCLGKRATPDIVGFYGELLVWKKLKSLFGWQGYKIKLGQGQSRADIVMEKNGERLNIEIKTSRLKHEWFGEGYGFAINIKKCTRHRGKLFKHPKKGEIEGDFCYFDYLVAVLLSEDLKKREFRIFHRSFFEDNEKNLRNINKRFSSATHRLIFIKTDSRSKEIMKFDRNLVKNKNMHKDWNMIILKTS